MSGCTRPSTCAFRAPGKTAYLFGDLTEAEYDAVMAGQKIEPRPTRCHSFVTNGEIQFLDCTHSLRGQTVRLTGDEL